MVRRFSTLRPGMSASLALSGVMEAGDDADRDPPTRNGASLASVASASSGPDELGLYLWAFGLLGRRASKARRTEAARAAQARRDDAEAFALAHKLDEARDAKQARRAARHQAELRAEARRRTARGGDR